MALILGDALHNLRAALDNLVYALAIAQTEKDPPDDETRLAFPICTKPELFDGQRFRIASLNEKTRAAIERLQPYNRLNPGGWFMPLWFLSSLNDVDKHRLLHIAATAAKIEDFEIGAASGSYEAFWNESPFRDGTPILKVVLTSPDPDVYVDFEASGEVVLDLIEYPPMSLYWTTKHIRRGFTSLADTSTASPPLRESGLPRRVTATAPLPEGIVALVVQRGRRGKLAASTVAT